MRSTHRGEMVLAVVVVLTMTLFFFHPVLRGRTFSTVPGHQTGTYPWRALPSQFNDTYPQTDQADASYPWHSFVSDTLRHGSFPFWDPHSFSGGYPFFSNGQSAVLYPPRLATALTLSPAWSHDVMSMLHVFLAGVFMYAFMKELATGFAGALLAAVAWMFGGFNMAWLHLEPVAPVAVFLPLSLLAVRRAFRRRSWRGSVLAGLVLGLTLMAGHILFLGAVYAVAVVYAAALAVSRLVSSRHAEGGPRWASEVAQLAAMVTVSLGTAAVVLLPTAAAFGASQRDALTYPELTSTVLRLRDGLLPLLPPPRTFIYTFVPPPLPITAPGMHQMAFVGTLTAGLAVGGFFLRRPGAALGRGLFIVVLLVVVGGPATWLVYHFLPGFAVFRPYSRLLFLSAFAVAVLGGVGLDALSGWARARSARDLLQGALVARGVVAGGSLLCLAATFTQLVGYGRAVNPPFAPRRESSLFPATPLIRATVAEVRKPGQWPGRVIPTLVADGEGRYPPAHVLYAAEALLFGIDSAGGYDSVVPRRVAGLARVLQGEDTQAVLRSGLPSAYAPTFLSTEVRFDLLERMGITTIVASPRLSPAEDWGASVTGLKTTQVYSGADGRVIRLNGARRGPYLVHRDEIVADGKDAFRRFIDPGFDFRRSVVLEKDELRRTRERPVGPGTGNGLILGAERGFNSARIEARTTAPAWLVIPDSWSPGWSASIDGRRVAVLRANYAKRAIRIPAGASTVELRYRPPGFAVGLYLTAATLASSGVALATGRRRQGKQRAEDESVDG